MITFNSSKTSIFKSSANAYLIFYDSIEQLNSFAENDAIKELVSYLKKHIIIEQNKQHVSHHIIPINNNMKTIFLAQVSKNDLNNCYRHAAASASRLIKTYHLDSLSVGFCSNISQSILDQCIEGFVLGTYSYDALKTKKKSNKNKFPTITYHVNENLSVNGNLDLPKAAASAQNIARDLANTPSNLLTPKDVVTFVQQTFTGSNVSLNIIDKKSAEQKNMGAFLAVAQGSACLPYCIELTINPSKEKPIILVGKGVTFDTGGISIKPSKSMSLMKGDMGGAACVIAAMKGLIDSKTTKHVKAIVPLVENMPSSTAYKPGDVITAMNGTSIEVINTDAEGRLILADALCLATSYNPAYIIDVATLTGACTVALGDVATAILGNTQSLIDRFCESTKPTGERFWQLPLYEEFKHYLKSDVADIMHCAENRLAGTSTAAIFLQEFVQDVPWIHLDIASTMHHSATKGYNVKGMAGVATRSLIQFVLNS